MKATVSFHPVRVAFFDDMVQPLLGGGKVNPEVFLNDCLRARRHAWRARCYQLALEELLARAEPPRAEPGAGLLRSLKAKLDRFDHREDALTRRVRAAVDADLHLHGRPFFITEGSAARVADRVEAYRTAAHQDAVDVLAVEQLALLDAELAKTLPPTESPEPSADLTYRSDLLKALKELFDIPKAAREGASFGPASGPRRPGVEVLASEVPWRAVHLHARFAPFWIGRDVDGLETVCRAAGVEPPRVLVPPWRLFAAACEEFPDLREALRLEMRGPRDVGAFVAPADVPELLAFLGANGSRIIQVATKHDAGTQCSTLLRKIRECATYAESHGMGYLEASGILHPDLPEAEDDGDAVSS